MTRTSLFGDVKMIDLKQERQAFEESHDTASVLERIEYIAAINCYIPKYEYANQLIVMQLAERFNFGWIMWQKAKAQAAPENTEDWYLDEDEGLWLDHDGIDGTLCELSIGEVQPVKHKEYLITQSNTLYAARVWDSEDDHIAWKLFESEEAALDAAKYCKQMYDASESGAEQ